MSILKKIDIEYINTKPEFFEKFNEFVSAGDLDNIKMYLNFGYDPTKNNDYCLKLARAANPLIKHKILRFLEETVKDVKAKKFKEIEPLSRYIATEEFAKLMVNNAKKLDSLQPMHSKEESIDEKVIVDLSPITKQIEDMEKRFDKKLKTIYNLILSMKTEDDEAEE